MDSNRPSKETGSSLTGDASPTGDALVDPAWTAEFEAARKRSLALRWRYSFHARGKPLALPR